MPTAIHDPEILLAASAATPAFRAAVTAVGNTSRQATGLTFNPGTPAIKALRAVAKLLEAEPTLPIDTAHITAQSGCSDFRGTLKATLADGTDATFDFTWDCAWRATEEGYKDHWGHPDQIRAAREFGYQCFERWTRTA